MAIPYLFGAKIKAKPRAKPKEGLQTCFGMFRFVNKKTDIDGSRRK
jgi:hypothetical protein